MVTGSPATTRKVNPLSQPLGLNLNDVISHVQSMLRRLIAEDIEIVTHFVGDLWAVKADPGQIEHVLMNLAANARDAMPQGGKLFLKTANAHLDDAYARTNVHVAPARGMEAHTQARIFEPFFTSKPVGTGTGAGIGNGLRHRETEWRIHNR